MAKVDKTGQGSKKKKRAAKSVIREHQVIEKAFEGKTGSEIAEDLGISRQRVSQILTSEQVESLLKQSESRLKSLVGSAIDTLEYAMDRRDSPDKGAVGNAIRAAIPILKTAGLVKESVDVSHQFPKPMVIEFSDGKQIVLGTENDVKKGGDGN